MIYAIVKNGKTINIIEWDGETRLDLPEGETLVPQNQAPEYLPEKLNLSTPSSISPAQLRTWLIRNGLGMSIIETLLDGIKDGISEEDQISKLLSSFMILTKIQKEQIMLEASMVLLLLFRAKAEI